MFHDLFKLQTASIVIFINNCQNMRTCLNTLYKRSARRKLYENQSQAGLFFAATVSVCFEAEGARVGNLILCLYIYIYLLNYPKNCLKKRVCIHAIARAYIVSVKYRITLC